jgi:perosamine synthetase
MPRVPIALEEKKMKVKWSEFKLEEEEIEAVIEVLRSADISGFSSKVEEFEQLAQKETGSQYTIACCNGTAALIVAFLAFKQYLEKNLVIAVPTWTYIAPVNAADLVGEVRLTDSDIKTHNMSSMKIDDGVNLIAPVDMAGVPADYDAFKKYNLPVVADAAESLGASYKGKKVGTLADISITSFQSSKVVMTGEGGMIFTDNSDLAKICRDLVNQGYGPKGYDEHFHVAKGYNFRMPGIQAALGCIQIKKLTRLVEKRRKKAQIYQEILGEYVGQHELPEHLSSSYYSFLIMLASKEKRDSLKKFLSNQNIETKLWSPVHRHPPYNSYSGFPNAELIYETHLRLPIHNLMSDSAVEFVAEKVVEWAKSQV